MGKVIKMIKSGTLIKVNYKKQKETSKAKMYCNKQTAALLRDNAMNNAINARHGKR